MIHARFGRVTHTVFCVYALLINLVILTAVAVVGVALIQHLVIQVSGCLRVGVVRCLLLRFTSP